MGSVVSRLSKRADNSATTVTRILTNFVKHETHIET